MTVLRVNEVFGPTAQGEGPSLGRRCSFVRLAMCNLACVWCDTPYTWDWTRHDKTAEVHERDPIDVAREVYAFGERLVVLSGGEPMMQQRQATPMLRWLRHRHVDVEVETNGTIPPLAAFDAYVTAYNVSPKITANSDNRRDRALRPTAIRALRDTGKARWKFVARSPADVDTAVAFADEYVVPISDVWIMPEGTTGADVARHTAAVADAAIQAGASLTTRLHVLAWGGRRAV